MLTLPLFFENIVKHETGFAIKQNAVHKVCIPAAGSVTETGVYPGFIAYFPTDTMRLRIAGDAHGNTISAGIRISS